MKNRTLGLFAFGLALFASVPASPQGPIGGGGSVTCSNCSGSGASAVDEAAFTAGTSAFAPGGAFFQTTATANALLNGQQGMLQATANRALFSNLRNSAGAEITTWPVTNAGTFAVQAAQSGAWTIALPTGASTDANATGGTRKTQIVDGSGNVVGTTANAFDVNIKSGGGTGGTASTFGAAFPATGTAAGMSQGGNMVALNGTAGNLNVQCSNCSGSGVSAADEAAFTAGTSLFAGSGGFFQTTATNNPLTTGQQGMLQLTANRAAFTNCRTAAGAECGVAAVPFQVSLANTGANGTKILVTPDSVALPANQSVNVAQLAGTATAVGNGTSSAGALRVAVVSDNTAVAGFAVGATGAAPPANAHYLGANASGATGGLLAGVIQCDKSITYDASTSGSTELQALTAARTIYVCGYTVAAAGTVNVKLIYGTGTACATGSNNLTPAWQLIAQAGVGDASTFWRGMKTASANALCINTSAGVAVQAIVYYTIL